MAWGRMAAENTKENQNDINLIAVYMLPMIIITGGLITATLYKIEIKLDTCEAVLNFPMTTEVSSQNSL